MNTPLIDVAYIAKLARIELTDEETARFTEDLSQVLDYVTQLQQWDTDGIEPMYHPVPTFDALRSDEPQPGLTPEDALMNAPLASAQQIRVPKVVESA